MSENPGASPGYTLLELVVALALLGIFALTVAGMLGLVGDGAARITAARRAHDREMAAGRWLARTVRSMQVGQEAGPFVGNPTELEFGSWLESPWGWVEPGRVRIEMQGDSVVVGAGATRFVLYRGVSGLHLDYLLEGGADARWASQWHSTVSAPVVVRLRAERAGGRRDTLLLLVGERG